MTRLIFPLLAALLLLPSCGNCKRACATRYCPPAAPTRPICPQAKPACKQATPKCGCKKKQRSTPCSHRHAVSLSEVMDYLPGVAPGYLNI